MDSGDDGDDDDDDIDDHNNSGVANSYTDVCGASVEATWFHSILMFLSK